MNLRRSDVLRRQPVRGGSARRTSLQLLSIERQVAENQPFPDLSLAFPNVVRSSIIDRFQPELKKLME